MRYGELEASLIEAFGVEERDAKAFRARIRHLRRYGITPAGSGNGKQIWYRQGDAVRLFWALVLNRTGMMPELVGSVLAEQGAPDGPEMSFTAGDASMVVRVDPEVWRRFKAAAERLTRAE